MYNASLLPVPLPGGPQGEVALSFLENIGEAKRLRTHQLVLNKCLTELAGLVLSIQERAREPNALVIGLPAALSLDNLRVQGEAPQGWTDPQMPTIDKIVEDTWRSLRLRSRHSKGELPDLPRCSDGRLALTADADVVLDTLGAMYSPTRIGVEPPDPRRARVLLGVKHSVGIRSTVITRGAADLHRDREHRRSPGQRRDSVYRGAFGDTIGLGHSIALIARAHQETQELAYDETPRETITEYHERKTAAGWSCSCGAVDPPHLNQVASWGAVEERLTHAGLSVGPNDIWEGIDLEIHNETDAGIRARLILEETGRLLAYALDTGVRLYDPEAIVVTGKMAFNDTLWTTVSATAAVVRGSTRRCLVRAADIPGDDVVRPVGPRGAAWLGFDTWVFPALLAERDAASHR